MKKAYIKIGIVMLAICGTYTLLACNSQNTEALAADEQPVDLSAPASTTTSAKEGSISAAEFDALIKGDKLTMVDFYTTWCGPCKLMAPDVEKLKTTNGDMVNVVKVDAENQLEIAGKFNINAYPTIMFFKKGQVIQTLVGAHKYDQLLTEVKKLK